MRSLRTQAAKIGKSDGDTLRYSEFVLRPNRLSVAMLAMESPGSFVAVDQSADRQIDEDWTTECQGIAWTGSHWIASSNGNDWSPHDVESKALYTFNAETKFRDADVVNTFRFTAGNLPGFPIPIYHVGALTYQDGILWLDHWSDITNRGQVLKFAVTNGIPTYKGFVELVHPSGRVGFVGRGCSQPDYYHG